MAQQEKVRPLNIQPVGSSVTSGHTSFGLAAQSILNKGGSLSAYQKAVADRTHNNLTEQAGAAILGVHAAHLANQVGQYKLERIDESMAFDRTLRKKRRNREDQAHMEEICHRHREFSISAHEAIYNIVVDRLVDITGRPLTPEKEETETVIIEQDPGIFGRLFGRSRTTTVKR